MMGTFVDFELYLSFSRIFTDINFALRVTPATAGGGGGLAWRVCGNRLAAGRAGLRAYSALLSAWLWSWLVCWHGLRPDSGDLRLLPVCAGGGWWSLPGRCLTGLGSPRHGDTVIGWPVLRLAGCPGCKGQCARGEGPRHACGALGQAG